MAENKSAPELPPSGATENLLEVTFADPLEATFEMGPLPAVVSKRRARKVPPTQPSTELIPYLDLPPGFDLDLRRRCSLRAACRRLQVAGSTLQDWLKDALCWQDSVEYGPLVVYEDLKRFPLDEVPLEAQLHPISEPEVEAEPDPEDALSGPYWILTTPTKGGQCPICARFGRCSVSRDGAIAHCANIPSDLKSTHYEGGYFHDLTGKGTHTLFPNVDPSLVERLWDEEQFARLAKYGLLPAYSDACWGIGDVYVDPGSYGDHVQYHPGPCRDDDFCKECHHRLNLARLLYYARVWAECDVIWCAHAFVPEDGAKINDNLRTRAKKKNAQYLLIKRNWSATVFSTAPLLGATPPLKLEPYSVQDALRILAHALSGPGHASVSYSDGGNWALPSLPRPQRVKLVDTRDLPNGDVPDDKEAGKPPHRRHLGRHGLKKTDRITQREWVKQAGREPELDENYNRAPRGVEPGVFTDAVATELSYHKRVPEPDREREPDNP